MIVLEKLVFFYYFNEFYFIYFLKFKKYRKNYHCDIHIYKITMCANTPFLRKMNYFLMSSDIFWPNYQLERHF